MLQHDGYAEHVPPYVQPYAQSRLLDDYQKHGFASLPSIVEPELLKQVVAEMQTMPPTRHPDAWRTSEPIKKLATHPAILATLRELYRREPIPFQTLNFPISPQQPIHTDALHFSSFPAWYMCGVWIALEPVDVRNGPLCYYPGSHNEPFYTLADLGIKASLDQVVYQQNQIKYSNWLVARLQSRGLREHWFTCDSGNMMIWAANLAHGSIRILDQNRTRFSQVTHYFFQDCMYYIPAYSDIPIGKIHYKEVTNIITGEKVAHKYFEKQELSGQTAGPQLTKTQIELLQ